MKIWIFSYCWNEAQMLPFYLRHYCSFADKIIVYDDKSTDGTAEMLRRGPIVDLRPWPYQSGIHEDVMLEHSRNVYKEARGKADWIMCPDIDEILWAKDPRSILKETDAELIESEGFNMMCEGLPVDDGQSQIYQLCANGVRAPVYSKPIIFRPHLDMCWVRGKHSTENMPPVKRSKPLFKLLHYRYLGYQHTMRRNARNYDRVGQDKGAAWSCAPEYTGEHSAPWSAAAQKEAFNVIEV